MNSCSGGSSWTPPLPFLKTLFFLFILISLFINPASAEQITVTTADYGENLFDYSNGVLTNHDGVTYERSVDGVIIINDERFLAFAIRGDRDTGTETFTSMDFSWDWTVEQNGSDYIFHATNNNDNFLWEQTWYFYHDQGTPMKIEHYLENNLGVPINDATMFYIITVDANDTLEYNRIIYPVSDYTAEPLHKTGNFDDVMASVDFNDIFGFNFGDLISTGFNITEIYIGNFDFSDYPNQNVLAVGFTKGNSVFQDGSSVLIDPQIVAEPDTYAVYGHYDADFLTENEHTGGWDGTDIDTYVEMTSTQYTGLSTDDTTYVISGGDNQNDGYLYVNFSVPNVDSINWFNIEVIAIGDGTEGWYMGAYSDVADAYVTMGSTTTAGDVSLTYNVTDAEVATYSEITDNVANFSVAMWTSTSVDSSFDGDLIAVTFNYETPTGIVYFANTSETITISDTIAITKIEDTTLPTYSNEGTNTALAGESCTFSITYDDNAALHTVGQYIFATNNTGVWVNESAVNFTSTPETIETIKTLNSTGNTPIGYRWYADDNSGNINNTPIYTLITVKLPGVKISGSNNTSTEATAYTTSRETIITSDGTLWAFYKGDNDFIYGVNSTDNGSTWNTPELVNDVMGDTQHFVTAAIDSNDVIHVIWYGYGWGDNPGFANIQYKNRTASGWSTQENVTNKNETQFGPSVAVDSNDVVHLIWYGLGWGSNASQYNLQYINRTASGWGTQESVTNVAEIQRFPSTAIDSNDNIHVVWYGNGWGDNPDKRNAVYRNRTAGVWSDYQLFSDNGKENYLPVITIDNDDVIHTAWRVLNGSDTSIYYRNKTSSSWGTTEEIRTSTNGEHYPTISADNSNNIHIVWDRLSDGTLWYVNKTNDWGDIEYLGHAGNVTTSHPSTMWSMWPQIDGIRTGVPETGIGYTHTNSYANVHVRYDSRYLTWQTAVTYNTTYANVSETVTFTDTVTLTKIAAPLEIDESDTITISDTVTLIKTLASVLYDLYAEETITITDSVSITKIVAPIIYEVYEDEIITITDNIDVNKILASVMYYTNVSDTVTFTDGLVVIKTVASVLYTTKVDDTITVTDSVGITKTSAPILNKINISDTVGIADLVSIEKTTASILYISNVPDTITITDGVALTKTLAAINYTSNVSDAITITDGVTLSKTTAGINYTTNISDTITITDGVMITKTLASINYTANVSETITFTDSAALIKITAPVNYITNVSEIITFTDDVALIKTTAGIIYTVNISDTIAVIDSVSLTKTLAAINYTTNVSDIIIFADSASLIKTTAVINYTRNVSDTISITDSVALTKTLAAINYTINVSEIITVTDSVVMNKTTAGINYSIDEPETITITDSVSMSKILAAINYTTNVSDIIIFADGVSLEKTTAGINY
ncbi:MAG: hypothetical protein KAS66_08880, partial [Candidatus Omnitrophica bacterium]|nr:hypothetical protein [Candidatus Omnitrophota bacterium]